MSRNEISNFSGMCIAVQKVSKMKLQWRVSEKGERARKKQCLLRAISIFLYFLFQDWQALFAAQSKENPLLRLSVAPPLQSKPHYICVSHANSN